MMLQANKKKRDTLNIPQPHSFVDAFPAEAMQAFHHCSCFANDPCRNKMVNQ